MSGVLRAGPSPLAVPSILSRRICFDQAGGLHSLPSSRWSSQPSSSLPGCSCCHSFALLRGNTQQSAGDGYSVAVVRSVPALPAGLTPASRFYQIYVHKSAGGAVSISLPLIDPRSARPVGFGLLHLPERELATIVQCRRGGGRHFGGRTSAPTSPCESNLAETHGKRIAGYGKRGLPAGKTLSPEAFPELTMALNPAGFTPLQDDGTLSGDEPPAVPGAQYRCASRRRRH